MKYQLYSRVDGRWLWQCDIEAVSHQEAFFKATLGLKPDHADKPIRLEQVEGDSRALPMARQRRGHVPPLIREREPRGPGFG